LLTDATSTCKHWHQVFQLPSRAHGVEGTTVPTTCCFKSCVAYILQVLTLGAKPRGSLLCGRHYILAITKQKRGC